MTRALARLSNSFVAYICLLCGFAGLGIFVHAAATGSAAAVALGVAMAVCFGASAMLFRAGARKLARTNDSGIPIDAVNVWAKPLRRAQVDHYLETYRGTHGAPDAGTPLRAPLSPRHRSHVSRNTNVSRSQHRGYRHLRRTTESPLPR